MPRKHYSIDQLASSSPRQIQNTNASLQRDLNGLRDNVAELSRGLRALNPVSHARTARTTTSSVWADVAGIGFGLLNSNLFGGSFYSSGAQSSSASYDLMQLSQRIR